MIAVRALSTESTLIQPPSAPQRTARAAACVADAAEAAVPMMRHFARRAARHWLVPAETIDALELVVTELITNAVLHSGSDEIDLLMTCNGTELTAEVKDHGRWDGGTVSQEKTDAAEATCGRGLDLVRYLTDWWLAFTSPAGTRVVARLSMGVAD